MKFIAAIALVLTATQAKSLKRLIEDGDGHLVMVDGIDSGSLQSGAHWRKRWPEGVDHGDDDAEAAVLGSFPAPKRPQENPSAPDPTYPWSYDEEVIHTAGSIKAAEKIKNHPLTGDSVKAYRGRNWIPKYPDPPRLASPPKSQKKRRIGRRA